MQIQGWTLTDDADADNKSGDSVLYFYGIKEMGIMEKRKKNRYSFVINSVLNLLIYWKHIPRNTW